MTAAIVLGFLSDDYSSPISKETVQSCGNLCHTWNHTSHELLKSPSIPILCSAWHLHYDSHSVTELETSCLGVCRVPLPSTAHPQLYASNGILLRFRAASVHYCTTNSDWISTRPVHQPCLPLLETLSTRRHKIWQHFELKWLCSCSLGSRCAWWSTTTVLYCNWESLLQMGLCYQRHGS